MATPMEKYRKLRERVDSGKSTSDEFDEYKRMRRFYDQYLDDSGKTMEEANENALNRYDSGDYGRRERDEALLSKLTGQEEHWSPGRSFRQTEERNPDVDRIQSYYDRATKPSAAELSENNRRRAFYDDYLENSGQTANRMYEGTINAYKSGKSDDSEAYADAVGRKVSGRRGSKFDSWTPPKKGK